MKKLNALLAIIAIATITACSTTPTVDKKPVSKRYDPPKTVEFWWNGQLKKTEIPPGYWVTYSDGSTANLTEGEFKAINVPEEK